MSEKYPAAAAEYDPAMTFTEIGLALGITKQKAYHICVRALKKLRQQPAQLRILAELIELRQSVRGETPLPDWDV